jgi:hypothetical protein
MRVFNDTLYNSAYVSGDLPLINMDHIAGASIYAKWTTSGTGTIKLQKSCDDINWTDITSSSQSISGNGSYHWDIVDAFYKSIKVVVSTGLDTLYISTYGKGF